MQNKTNKEIKSSTDKAIDKFVEMMISQLEEAEASQWKKGWIGGNGCTGIPTNLSGRSYSGTNSLFLLIDTAKNGYAAPVYMTFLQKEKEGLRIKKGASAMPVIYWDLNIKDEKGKCLSKDDYNKLTLEEKNKCDVRPFLRSFRVYNIDQTNLKEVNEEKYNNIVTKYRGKQVVDTEGMYKNAAIDRMFNQQEWLCKIICNKPSVRAYYSPSNDMIVLPQKGQFKKGKTEQEIYKDGMEYYSTALHEMAHSTGAENRLNRNISNRFGSPKYAKEELVAELTSALTGYTMGFDRKVQENNAAYVKSWLTTLREEPQFIVSVMSDVNKASKLILDKIEDQKIALSKQKSEQQTVTEIKNVDNLSPIKSANETKKTGVKAAIYQLPTGSYVVRASVGEHVLEQKPIDNKTALSYLNLRDYSKKDSMLAEIVRDKYGEELHSSKREVKKQVSKGLKI